MRNSRTIAWVVIALILGANLFILVKHKSSKLERLELTVGEREARLGETERELLAKREQVKALKESVTKLNERLESTKTRETRQREAASVSESKIKAELESKLSSQKQALTKQAKKIKELERARELLSDRIREIIRKDSRVYENAARPDGRVLKLDEQRGRLWIDCGSKHGLMTGARFQVYRVAKGGHKRITGVIEILRTELEQSEAVVLDIRIRSPRDGSIRNLPDPDIPLKVGDLIRNPLFDPEIKPVYVFIGRQLKLTKKRLEEIKNLIVERGGQIAEKVTIETDFAVLLDDKDPSFQQQFDDAVQLGAVLLRERELLEYVGLKEGPGYGR